VALVKEVEDRATLAEREARERVWRMEAESAAGYTYARARLEIRPRRTPVVERECQERVQEGVPETCQRECRMLPSATPS
jgi:hypothetical protein